MEALKAELERKRKERESAAGAPTLGGDGKRKWVRKGDIERARVAKYHEDEAIDEAERKKRLVVPCLKRYDEAQPTDADAGAARARASAGGSSGAGKSADAAAPAEKTPQSAGEVKRLLRKLGQPIQLFGEEDEARLERYQAVHAAVLAARESDEDIELKQGQMFNETQLYDETGRAKQEGVQAEHEGADAAQKLDVAFEGDEELADGFTASTPEQIVSKHFKTLIKLWETEINGRPADVAQSVDGRKETAAYLQCRRHMKPFFRQLSSRAMPFDMLNTMVEITTHMVSRDYVKAHDAYISCAIGNAPWPMGVSGTGIHERQGRQHIRESKIANVMNNETQRKYLQSVKRLLTFSQRVLPASGPSQMVM